MLQRKRYKLGRGCRNARVRLEPVASDLQREQKTGGGGAATRGG